MHGATHEDACAGQIRATDQEQPPQDKEQQEHWRQEVRGDKKAQKYLKQSAANTTPKPTKRKPASSSPEKTTRPTKKPKPHAAPATTAQKGKHALAFPGENKRPPLTYGKSVVYFSPGRYRLMKTKGDRVDVAFPHKLTGARVAWSNLCIELRKLNPGV